MNRRTIVRTCLLGAGVLVAAAAAFTDGRTSPASAGGVIDPAHFVRHITNPYLPTGPGRAGSTPGRRTGSRSATSSQCADAPRRSWG